MTAGDADDLRRQFDALTSGAELSDLRQLFGNVAQIAGGFVKRTHNPHLRRPRRTEPVVLRVRVDLNDAEPPIWRRLDLRSDLTLASVHQVLQTAYDWSDSHLHRFSIGGDTFDMAAEWFLCEWEVEEGEDEGTPDTDVTLEETLVDPGDVLHYVYDYGDNWDLTIRLEEVIDLTDGTPAARCLEGERAAPPDDCGGLRDAEDLAEILADPTAFDVDDLNHRLVSPATGLADWGVRRELVDLLDQLIRTPVGGDLVARAVAISTPEVPDAETVRSHLAAYQWFLDRAADNGIPLTAAGYMKPAEVEAAAGVVPAASDWIGKKNREDLTVPILEFRQSLQQMGLLRKFKGSLLLTRAGKVAQRDAGVLWQYLADHLVDGSGDTFGAQARLLALLCLASEPKGAHERRLADALTHLGWRQRDGRPVSPDQGQWAIREVINLLGNVAEAPRDRPMPRSNRRALSPVAVLLINAALTSDG
ncbi:plasmid pRiA4b ORF-3 family protein [Nocardioides caeni]|uniref:plasmid pRiA4b ORF-3 family protein n=1 Tax=Nocardioides caeni TaxID=574700 RepID=UPI001305099E|nr:plasmid pRiA4b ORF-3 family protein [Nocardioides caeni]